MILEPAISRLVEKIAPKEADNVVAQLESFASHLLEHNKKVNLVSRQNTIGIINDLVFDCLSMLEHYRYEDNATLLDIGSGAGFPCLVHKIVCPSLKIISVDSVKKKIAFQESAIAVLSLKDCRLMAERIEGLKPLRVDYAIAKGLGEVKLVCELAAPHLRKGGVLIMPRSTQEQVDQTHFSLSYEFLKSETYRSSLAGRESILLVLKRR